MTFIAIICFLVWLSGAINTMLFLLADELDDNDRSIIQSFRASKEKGLNTFYSGVWPLVSCIAVYLVIKEFIEGDY